MGNVSEKTSKREEAPTLPPHNEAPEYFKLIMNVTGTGRNKTCPILVHSLNNNIHSFVITSSSIVNLNFENENQKHFIPTLQFEQNSSFPNFTISTDATQNQLSFTWNLGNQLGPSYFFQLSFPVEKQTIVFNFFVHRERMFQEYKSWRLKQTPILGPVEFNKQFTISSCAEFSMKFCEIYKYSLHQKEKEETSSLQTSLEQLEQNFSQQLETLRFEMQSESKLMWELFHGMKDNLRKEILQEMRILSKSEPCIQFPSSNSYPPLPESLMNPMDFSLSGDLDFSFAPSPVPDARNSPLTKKRKTIE